MNVTRIVQYSRFALRACNAAWVARKERLQGNEFAEFGRLLGGRMVWGGYRPGVEYLIAPVKNVRYFEFSEALSCLPAADGRWLDVSSPRLFSFYVARHRPGARLEMINPDTRDFAQSMEMVKRLGLANVSGEPVGVDVLAERRATYDCMWAISVVEHIAGAYDDRQALRWMYDALKPGGRLFVSVPVDRRHWDEYRQSDAYGTQPRASSAGHFFQRYYDEQSIRARLIQPLGVEPVRVSWFGERRAGRFAQYERRWMSEGVSATIDDPIEMITEWQSYPSWSAMPGQGVCAFQLVRH